MDLKRRGIVRGERVSKISEKSHIMVAVGVSAACCQIRQLPSAPSSDLRVIKASPGPYRLGQDWIGTVEMALCGEPSITRSL